MQELDAQRSKLPATVRIDLTSQRPTAGTAGLEQFQIWGGDKAEFSRDHDGLKVVVPGAENWEAAGLVPRVSFEGDFDISLNIEVLQLEPSKAGDESTVLLQTEFNDALKSVSEIKYSIDTDGHRTAETQRRRARPDGSLDYQELQSSKASTAKLLRLARRGAVIYQIFQESDTAHWDWDGESVRLLSHHNNDYLYFRSPLTGCYEVECDSTGFDYREAQLLVAGTWVVPAFSHNEYFAGRAGNDLDGKRKSAAISTSRDGRW